MPIGENNDMKLNVLTKTLAGTKTSFVFGTKSNRYVVKNFTENAITVAFDDDATDADGSIKIPSGMGQYVECQGTAPFGVDTVYVTGTGDVEVQQL